MRVALRRENARVPEVRLDLLERPSTTPPAGHQRRSARMARIVDAHVAGDTRGPQPLHPVRDLLAVDAREAKEPVASDRTAPSIRHGKASRRRFLGAYRPSAPSHARNASRPGPNSCTRRMRLFFGALPSRLKRTTTCGSTESACTSSRRRYASSLEVRRGLYMDERSGARLRGFEEIRERISTALRTITPVRTSRPGGP